MTKVNKILKEVRINIASNNLQLVFDNLLKNFIEENFEYSDELISISAKYYRLKKDQIRGVLSYEQLYILEARLVQDLLTLINVLEKTEHFFTR